MHAAFALPVHTNGEVGDPFQAVRRMWDTCRSVFLANVSPSWLLIVDESMVKWVGRNMPGLMVVPRKPTPMGLELHTVCCAVSGILVNFEMYEGKERMEAKQFVGEVNEFGPINKSTALTLRCVQPWFGSVRLPSPSFTLVLPCIHSKIKCKLTLMLVLPTKGRVLVADSWFGSVACALELFLHGIFSIMNVKTGTKGYPKQELMVVVDGIKGKSEEARRRRRER
eukprot:5136073-Pleurochrysis_carterae.AAC.1